MPRLYTTDDLRVGMLVRLSDACGYPGAWAKVTAVHSGTIDVWVPADDSGSRYHDATLSVGHVVDSRDTHTLPAPPTTGRYARQQQAKRAVAAARDAAQPPPPRGAMSPAAARRAVNGGG